VKQSAARTTGIETSTVRSNTTALITVQLEGMPSRSKDAAMTHAPVMTALCDGARQTTSDIMKAPAAVDIAMTLPTVHGSGTLLNHAASASPVRTANTSSPPAAAFVAERGASRRCGASVARGARAAGGGSVLALARAGAAATGSIFRARLGRASFCTGGVVFALGRMVGSGGGTVRALGRMVGRGGGAVRRLGRMLGRGGGTVRSGGRAAGSGGGTVRSFGRMLGIGGGIVFVFARKGGGSVRGRWNDGTSASPDPLESVVAAMAAHGVTWLPTPIN